MSEIQSYKIQKYLNKLQSVSQDHPSYQLYLSKYMYWLEGGVIFKTINGNNMNILDKAVTATYQLKHAIYRYCGQTNNQHTLYRIYNNNQKNETCTTANEHKITVDDANLAIIQNHATILEGEQEGYLVKIKVYLNNTKNEPILKYHMLHINNIIKKQNDPTEYKFIKMTKDKTTKINLYSFSTTENINKTILEIPLETLQNFIFSAKS